MPEKCEKEKECDCEDMMDSKIESVKEYIDKEIKDNISYVFRCMDSYENSIPKKVNDIVKKKLKKILFYVLPPLTFLLVLAMII